MAKVTLTSKSNAMKSCLPLLTFAIILTSCSSVYKSGQTPDDVYFSPERQRDEYVRVEEQNERTYRSEEADREERYLRMKTRNRRYGLLENEYDCYCYNANNYNRYNDYYRMNTTGFNYNRWMWDFRYGSFYNDPFYFNPYYGNPYYSGVVYGNVTPKFNKPRTANLHVFDGNGNNYNPNMPKGASRTYSGTRNTDNYRGSGTNAGDYMRDVFGGSNNSGSNSNSAKTSTNSNSSNNNNSSSGSGTNRASTRKF